MRNNAPKTGMKTDKRTATDGNPGGCPRHHVMVARAVISLIVSNRPNDRKLIGNGRQSLHGLREKHAGRLSGDGPKLATYLDRGLWLGIKGLVVTRASIHPDQDARIGLFPDRFSRPVNLSSCRPQSPGQSTPNQTSQTELQAVSA